LRPRLATHPAAVPPGHSCGAILPPPAPPVQPQSRGAAAGRAGGRGRRGGVLGRAGPAGWRQKGFEFPSMLPLLSSSGEKFFLPWRWVLHHTASRGLAASCSVGANRLQRPSLRAGSNTRHPMLSASCDESGKSCRRRPHLSDGFVERLGRVTGRLHQHLGRDTPTRWKMA
jgi:hypothetical protein